MSAADHRAMDESSSARMLYLNSQTEPDLAQPFATEPATICQRPSCFSQTRMNLSAPVNCGPLKRPVQVTTAVDFGPLPGRCASTTCAWRARRFRVRAELGLPQTFFQSPDFLLDGIHGDKKYYVLSTELRRLSPRRAARAVSPRRRGSSRC